MTKSIKNYVCPCCFNQIKTCACSSTPYQLIMIDLKLQYAIRELNLKNYLTGTCCEGHYQGVNNLSSIFIGFVYSLNQQTIDSIPNGWKIRNKNYLYYNFKPKSKQEFLQTQAKEIEKLNIFVDNLKKNTMD